MKISAVNPPLFEFWIGKSDYSLRRSREIWPVVAEPNYDLEVQVDYAPKFDGPLAPARFVFTPPVVEPVRDSCADRGVASKGSEPMIDDSSR